MSDVKETPGANDDTLQPQTTDPANGADRTWPDEAKILPDEFLKDEAAK